MLHNNRFGSAHFVKLKGIDDSWAKIDDPGWGGINYTHAQLEKYWLHEDGLGRELIFLKDEKTLINSNKIHSKRIRIQ
ncbi:hypothetical protein CPI84_03485 [Erwinia pyrifoliae]|nr:hypothetical protein CPI84_03485 [Erwinia pyrifoliae]MCA8878141.1 hypothetical protein [Erwinia pyrifoliae]